MELTVKPDHVVVFDTTMRDGEQSPGASMSIDEKIELAKILEDMGVDVIEAGFPIASNGDFDAVRKIAQIVTESTICGLARASVADIERCAEAVRPAARGRIHTFISTSPSHRDHILRMSPADVIDAVHGSVTHARNLCGDVEWSAQDATRTERDVLRRCVETAIRAGATTINIPDTVGYTYPSEYADIFRDLIENVPGADAVIFSTHCHNDLGLAVANSLSGVLAGARQVEVAINGIGERAGNTALEEVVMALKVRGDRLPFATGVRSEHITRASRYVSAITGFPVQFNKAIVGKNAFAHEAGIHQDGMLENSETYEDHEARVDVGQGGSNLRWASTLAVTPSARSCARWDTTSARTRSTKPSAASRIWRTRRCERLRRRHHRPGGRLAGARGGPYPGQAPAGHRRHRGSAGSPPDAGGGRGRIHRHGDGRRTGGRSLQRHPRDRAARRRAAPLPGACGDGGHGRPGPGLGAAGGRRPHRHRPGRRHRHPDRQRHGRIHERPQQPLRPPRERAPPNRSPPAASSAGAVFFLPPLRSRGSPAKPWEGGPTFGEISQAAAPPAPRVPSPRGEEKCGPMLWIPITVGAAGLQVARNAFQCGLLVEAGPWGATLVRFLFGLPFAALFLGVAVLVGGPVSPRFGAAFWMACVVGATAQMVATAAMLVSMRRSSFALGTVFQQSSIFLAGLVGLAFGEPLSGLKWSRPDAGDGRVGHAWLAAPPGGRKDRLRRAAGPRRRRRLRAVVQRLPPGGAEPGPVGAGVRGTGGRVRGPGHAVGGSGRLVAGNRPVALPR